MLRLKAVHQRLHPSQEAPTHNSEELTAPVTTEPVSESRTEPVITTADRGAAFEVTRKKFVEHMKDIGADPRFFKYYDNNWLADNTPPDIGGDSPISSVRQYLTATGSKVSITYTIPYSGQTDPITEDFEFTYDQLEAVAQDYPALMLTIIYGTMSASVDPTHLQIQPLVLQTDHL